MRKLAVVSLVLAVGFAGAEQWLRPNPWHHHVPAVTEPVLVLAGFPNPAGSAARTRWQVPSPGPVSVSLYDAAGRMRSELWRTAKGLSGTRYAQHGVGHLSGAAVV